MAHLLSYTSGVIGYGLSNDLDTAMSEAEERCNEMQQGACILDRFTNKVVATINYYSIVYKAIKEEI